jgi:hypothetical protein
MKQGELWTMAGGSSFAGKPRPVLIVQDDAFAERDSVTVCLITTDPADLPVFRIPVEPTADNGLRVAGHLKAQTDANAVCGSASIRWHPEIVMDEELRLKSLAPIELMLAMGR